MNRREFIALLGGAPLAWPIAARTQQAGKVHRIGFLANDPTIPRVTAGKAFLAGLRENGFVEGENLAIEYRFAEGSSDRLSELIAELVRLDVDLIVVSSTPGAKAAKQANINIPIVMLNVLDPVALGIVESLALPGGNITGLVQQISAEIAGKRLELLKEAAPQISRVAVLLNPDNAGDHAQWIVLERAARGLNLLLQAVPVREGSELEGALSKLSRDHPDALFANYTGLILTYRRRIVDFANTNRLPSMFPYSEIAMEGGLMSYGESRANSFRRAATYVAKILNGAKPADLPIEQPTKFDLVINLKAAKALGLDVPVTVLARADEVIE